MLVGGFNPNNIWVSWALGSWNFQYYIYIYIYILGPFLASFMVSSWRVCRTIWNLYKIPQELYQNGIKTFKNRKRTIQQIHKNHKRIPAEQFAQSKKTGIICKTHQKTSFFLNKIKRKSWELNETKQRKHGDMGKD